MKTLFALVTMLGALGCLFAQPPYNAPYSMAFTSWAGTTENWTNNGTSQYTTGHNAPNSVQLNSTGDNTISPTINSPDTMRVWLKYNGTDPTGNVFKIYAQVNGGGYAEIRNCTFGTGNDIPTTWNEVIIGLSATYEGQNNVQFKFEYTTKVSGNVALDDFSATAFYPLAIRSPNGDEDWRIFQCDTVLWYSAEHISGLIRIELNRHYPTGLWETLIDTTANDGEAVVFVTDPLSDSCRVRVRTLNGQYSDISDANFRIVSSQGYLALAQAGQPTSPILNWSAGSHECPETLETATIVYHLKNFGQENLVAFAPQMMAGTDFTLQSNCPASVNLAPGEISACSLMVTLNPQSAGSKRDTIRIQTDAVNATGGYVRIPLAGTQTRTPETPELVIHMDGDDAVLNWNAISQSTGGCPVTITRYLVFFSEEFNGPFWYHGSTTATNYRHIEAGLWANAMFYRVRAVAAPPALLELLPDAPGIVTEEDVVRTMTPLPSPR